MKYLRQCKLRRENRYTTVWIPDKLAKNNKIISRKIKGDWEDAWTVVSVGSRASKEMGIYTTDTWKEILN